jgi:hypothetical protein
MIPATMAVNRATAELATEMMALFGTEAGSQAAARAERFRDKGNAVNFCHWRQAERLIILLATEQVQGTIQ